MNQIRVLIGCADYLVTPDIERDVRASTEMHLVADAMTPGEALRRLDADPTLVDVLLLIGDVPAFDRTGLLKRHASLRILQLLTLDSAVRFDALGLSKEQVIDFLVAFGRERDSTLGGRWRTIAPTDRAPGQAVALPLPNPAAEAKPGEANRGEPKAAPKITGAPETDQLWAIVCDWLDAALHRFNDARPTAPDEMTGLTVPQALVVKLLTRCAAEDGEDAGADAVNAALNALDNALRTQAATPLARLFRALDLHPEARQLFLLALAPELDCRYQRVFGVFNDDMGQRALGFGVACAVIGPQAQVRTSLAAFDGLDRLRLLDRDSRHPPAFDEALRVDPPLCAWLLGHAEALEADPALQGALRKAPWPGRRWLVGEQDRQHGAALIEALRKAAGAGHGVVLEGSDVDGWRALLESAKGAEPLWRVDLGALGERSVAEQQDLAARLERLTLLRGGWLVLDASAFPDRPALVAPMGPLLGSLGSLGSLGTMTRVAIVARRAEIVLGALAGHEPQVLKREPAPLKARAAVLARAGTDAGLSLTGADAERLAAGLPVGLAQLDEAVRLMQARSARGEPQDSARDFARALRWAASPDLPRFARRLEASFQLDDVVLPPEPAAQLREIVANVCHAARVMQDWGFEAQLPYGRGVTALFSGPSGTGKTMAAQAIAQTLGVEAFVVDLSRIVSKYIGETEKHLDAVFDDAERAGAVLLFDEADALFGKRSEVRDAHDRYANIEVAYLLQRLEAFTGLGILTTNLRQNIDSAFLRRFRFIVEFPQPDVKAREELWRRCLPTTAPREAGLEAGLRQLAANCELNGGNIRQITVRAAFAAAQQAAPGREGRIGMSHLLEAALAEVRKLGLVGTERRLTALSAEFNRPLRAA
ncbi:ATP-binding protein [Variovorax sp. J2P1-59]|uniref:AAA family ATPase n=1 Tax=Variovorax flavidus TaxID=3053501 RepID=UPI002577F98B|nr:ATP-binding protein [Variovorax sp. J2P1-59]MDM0076884.1 ATP-binding protein [Variovorax sp. J2P1-59]